MGKQVLRNENLFFYTFGYLVCRAGVHWTEQFGCCHFPAPSSVTSKLIFYIMFKLDFSLCHVQLTFFYVMFGLGVDSWRERAIGEVRGLRDERGPTQLGIYPRTSLSWIPGTRCACPRMTEEKIILLLPALFFFLSLPDLIRQSRDSPVKPGNDRKE